MKEMRTGRNAFDALRGARLRSALRDIGIGADEFCSMTGMDPIEVRLWLMGHGELPRWVPGFLAAISVPEARQRAAVVGEFFLADIPFESVRFH